MSAAVAWLRAPNSAMCRVGEARVGRTVVAQGFLDRRVS